ncbi:MAG: DUF3857 domain-containing protein [Myxococcota bacterium]|nr:DUF3857 domain-containing protein [Myxococcota bacterium]
MRRLSVFLTFVAAAWTVASPARAEQPYVERLRQHVAEARRQGRAPAGILPILDAWRDRHLVPQDALREAFATLAGDAALEPARRAYVGFLLARLEIAAGERAAAEQRLRSLGHVASWRIVGPFDNEGGEGFDRAFGPETAGPTEPWRTEASYEGRERTVRWRDVPPILRTGYLSFDDLLRPDVNVCAYAATAVHVEDRDQTLTLWAGAGGAVRVWWNGAVVLEDPVYRAPDADRSVATVEARRGANVVLVKVCALEGTWGLYLRIGGRDGGAPPRGVRIDASMPAAIATTPTGDRTNVRASTDGARPTVRAVLDSLQRAAASARAGAADFERLARFLEGTGADDPVRRNARDLARRAAEREPTPARLRFAARLATERGDAWQFVERAIARFPGHPDAVLAHAEFVAGGPRPEAALDVLRGARLEGVHAIEAMRLRVRSLLELGLAAAAGAVAEELVAVLGEVPAALEARIEAAHAEGRTERAARSWEALVAARGDDLRARHEVALDALRRGEVQRAIAQIDAMREIAPGSASVAMLVAGLLDGIGRTDEALDVLRHALDVAPEEPALHVERGRILMRAGRQTAAADAFRAALSLRPQDAQTRLLLEQLAPEPRRDERHAEDSHRLLARRGARRGHPATILHELTVQTVHDNGLGSVFRQLAVEIHDEAGARAWSTYSIPFDPGSQRAELRLARVTRRDGRTLEAVATWEQATGEPWYRMYYDTRLLVVELPPLEPGDVVELRWRVDDVAHRNQFADYFGDVVLLQGFEPRRVVQYVLDGPARRRFHVAEPRLAGLRRSAVEENGRRIVRYEAHDVPAIEPEDGMPGLTEVAAHLHVSTYERWEQVGRWWWGLVRDQLVADDRIRETVRALLAGSPDLRETVRRIHAWVVRNTRYVALEFGIHGYKPYRVPLVVQRGFGDCKDKASLLYVMLREAGIDAQLVLVRTRQNGRIAPEPASLAVFDHAIAYVPALDLYLDGTAEHAGLDELPPMDQGVMVLHVGPDGVALRRTPVLGADRNVRERRLDVELQPDGAARLLGEETVRGNEASDLRAEYESPGTRAERLERALRRVFPGLQLVEQRIEGTERLDVPVQIRWRAEVPQLGRRDGDALRVPAAVLGDLVRTLARASSRRLPLELGGTSRYVEERIVRPPPGYRLGALPESGEVRGEHGAFAMRVEAEGNAAFVRTELAIEADRIEPESYAAWRAWVERVDAMLRRPLVLERRRP